MKKFIFILMLLGFSTITWAYGGTHYVRGYTRSNGTYVEGHRSGNPNSGIHCHDNVCS